MWREIARIWYDPISPKREEESDVWWNSIFEILQVFVQTNLSAESHQMFGRKLDLTDEKQFGQKCLLIFFVGRKKTCNIFFQTLFCYMNLEHFYIFPKHHLNSLFIWMKAQHIWSIFYTVIEEGRLYFLVSILKTYLLRWRLF